MGPELKELRRINEILKLASVFYPNGAQSLFQVVKDFVDMHRETYWAELICKVLQMATAEYFCPAFSSRYMRILILVVFQSIEWQGSF